MRYAFGFEIALSAITASASFCLAAAQPIDEAAHAAQVISQLDDVDSTVRPKALLQLNSLGAAALPVVEKAVASPESLSPERKRRLNLALAILRPRARETQLREGRRQWLRKDFISAYTTGGHTNPKWDAPATQAIDAYLTWSLNPGGNTQPLMAAAFNACKTAIDAGCDDPLIYTLYRMLAAGDMRVDASDKVPAWGRIRGKLKVPQYSELLLLWLDLDEGRILPAASIVLWHEWTFRFEKLAKSGTSPADYVDFLGRRIYRTLDTDPGGVTARIFLTEYKRISGRTIGTLLSDSDAQFKEISQVLYAQMTNLPDTWKAATKQLAEAEKINLEAEKIDPLDPRPSAELVHIKMLQFEATREDFERAFKHATELNPDNVIVYQHKMEYLMPDWRGDDKQLLEFGHQCLETENWRAGIPMTLIKIHEYLADKTGDADAYFTQPAVKKDINDVFAPHLLNFPDDINKRCTYAKYAMRCEDWATAKAQFDLIGDAFDHSIFPSKELYEHERDKAARLAARTAQPHG